MGDALMMDPGDMWRETMCFNGQEDLHVEKTRLKLVTLRSIADAGYHPQGKSN
jgi:hypothetical protein